MTEPQPIASVAVSPTGTPVVPPSIVPWFIAGFGVLEALAQTLPAHTIGAKVLSAGLPILGFILGVISPGWRK